MNLKRYLTILRRAVEKISVAREMSFKGNFILWIVVELLWFGLQFMLRQRRFSQTKTVGTWSQWQMVLAGRREQFHPAGVSGVLPRELHEPFRTRPHG